MGPAGRGPWRPVLRPDEQPPERRLIFLVEGIGVVPVLAPPVTLAFHLSPRAGADLDLHSPTLSGRGARTRPRRRPSRSPRTPPRSIVRERRAPPRPCRRSRVRRGARSRPGDPWARRR